jgi:hypothetical protein
VREIAINAKDASLVLAKADTDVKNNALRCMGLLLEKQVVCNCKKTKITLILKNT